MSIRLRPIQPGRVMIESDGCSDFYGGALVQGATVCRIAAPETLASRYTDRDGRFDLRAFLFDLDGDRMFQRGGMPGVRVLERRVVG